MRPSALVAQLRERPRGDQPTSGALFSEIAARQAAHLALERERLEFALALCADCGDDDASPSSAARAEPGAAPATRGRLAPPPLVLSTFPRPTSFSALPPPAAVVALADPSPCACAAAGARCDGRCGRAPPPPPPPDELVLALVAAHQADAIEALCTQLAALRAAHAPAWAELVDDEDDGNGGDGGPRDRAGGACALRSAEPICAERAAQLAALLALRPRLRALDLSHAPLDAPGAARLVSSFKFAPALRALRLDGCALGGGAVVHVAAELARPGCALRTLKLGSNALGDAGAAALGGALERNASVTRCDLARNQIGDAGARALARVLAAGARGVLVRLDLSGNAIGSAGASALALALSAHARARGPIRSLALGGNAALPADAAILLVRAVMAPGILDGAERAPPHVRLHGLGGGQGDDDDDDDGDGGGGGGERAPEASFALRSGRDAELTLATHDLHFDASLRCLRLCALRLTDGAALRVAGALRSNRALTSLDLMANALQNAGAAALGAALRVNATLQTLNLCNNAIGDDGAAALARALGVNRALRSLHLARNRLADGCAAAFAEGLGANEALRFLSLEENVLLGDHARETIRAAWRARAAEGTLAL